MRVYDSREEALKAAIQKVTTGSLLPSSELKQFLVLAGAIEEVSIDHSSDLPREFQPALLGKFAIRDSQVLKAENFLRVLKSASELTVGLVGLNTIVGTAATAAALLDLFKLYKDIKAAGTILSDEHLAVVGVLRDLGTASCSEVAEHLDEAISADAVEQLIGELEWSEENVNGFVLPQGGGTWTLVGL